MCESIKCEDCFLGKRKNGKLLACGEFVIGYPQEAEKIIMDWAKEHPVMTNADKFKEIFGYDLSYDLSYVKNGCLGFRCYENDCSTCEYYDFWNREYIEPKKENEDGKID